MSKALIFIETFKGKPKSASLELFSLALDKGFETVAVTHGIEDHAQLGKYGASKVVLLKGLGDYITGEQYATAIAQIVEKENPDLVLFPGTPNGKELTGLVAAKIGVPALTDVMEARLEDGKWILRRTVYTGKIFAEFTLTTTPAIFSMKVKSFQITERDTGDYQLEEYVPEGVSSSIEVLGVHAKETEEADVSEADIVISGGRGLGGPEPFDMLRKLAQEIARITGETVAIGASRAAVDAGWIDHSHQVGQTGKVISPRLYFAIGISGALQHQAGMRNSKFIVAINKDPEAPIFKLADVGIVEDLFKAVPELINRLKNP